VVESQYFHAIFVVWRKTVGTIYFTVSCFRIRCAH